MGNTFLNLALLIIFQFSIRPTFSMKLTTILTDQSALLALKNHVYDPENVLETNWSSSTHVCNWFRVSCGSRHHRVTALNLSGLGLVGTLPPSLGNLSFLSLLSITNNSFHGRLPVQLSNLRRLKHLSFGNNSFSGEIPSWLGSLTELRSLFLNHNNLNGVIPFSLGNLSKLEIWTLSGNQLFGSIPSSIFNISSLQKMDLSNNMLSGSIPPVSRDLLSIELINFNINNLTGHLSKDIANMLSGRIPMSLFKCKKLQMFSLSYNQLEGSLPRNSSILKRLCEIPRHIVNLTLLSVLDFPDNNFTGTIPHQIGNLQNLEYLHLGANNILSGHLPPNVGLWLPNLEQLHLDINQLFGSFPMSISNASQLTSLDISSNYFSGTIPDTLGNLRNLKRLNLETTNLSSSGMSFLSSLTNCRGLEVLCFGDNPLISGKLPGSIGNLSSSLQKFYGPACNIRGSIPSGFGNLSRLISIYLSHNKLTGMIPTTIGGLKELQKISFHHNKLDGPIPSDLCHLKKLAFLFLSSNKLSGPIPACLGGLIALRSLYLDSNMFSSTIPSTLTRISDLLILNLSSNSLSGPLPIDIGKWKVLTSMDLSNNQLSSDIPIGVADLQDVTYFSLSNNRIRGSIPESFGNLLSLEFLDLSRNNLSGQIPKSFEKLPYLKYFNVSFNRLQGEIPKGGSFGNYSFESFKGNEALCGAAQLHVPSCKTRRLRNSKVRTKLIIFVALPIASAVLVVSLIIIILRRRKRKDRSTAQEDLTPLGTWRRISYHDLHQATNGFSDRRFLGTGSYGSVYQGTLLDGMEVAVKVFKLELEGAFKSFDVECEVLRNIRHRNLIKIISSCSNDLDFKALVLEFMPNGSLDKWLYFNNHFLDILQRLNIMIDVASALEYLHHGNATPVVHCDLKPSNVLLDEDMVAHLGDFGIAKLLCKEDSMIHTMTMATIGYVAPGEQSLKIWVKESISSPLNQVVDTNLLCTIGSERSAANNCALSILHVGLECSLELPNERPNMKEIVTKLNKIKVKFLEDIEGGG
ncbi:hypothetical protein V6Z12_A01G048800 [Gossypium hirsutum]